MLASQNVVPVAKTGLAAVGAQVGAHELEHAAQHRVEAAAQAVGDQEQLQRKAVVGRRALEVRAVRLDLPALCSDQHCVLAPFVLQKAWLSP